MAEGTTAVFLTAREHCRMPRCWDQEYLDGSILWTPNELAYSNASITCTCCWKFKQTTIMRVMSRTLCADPIQVPPLWKSGKKWFGAAIFAEVVSSMLRHEYCTMSNENYLHLECCQYCRFFRTACVCDEIIQIHGDVNIADSSKPQASAMKSLGFMAMSKTHSVLQQCNNIEMSVRITWRLQLQLLHVAAGLLLKCHSLSDDGEMLPCGSGCFFFSQQ